MTAVRLLDPLARHIGDARDVTRAAEAHERLRRLAAGIESSGVRGRAMVELAGTDAPTPIRDLEAILADERTEVRFRHLAATLLGRFDSDVAREALLAAIETKDQRLAGTVAQSLGRIGGRAAHKPLVKAWESLTGVARGQALFALRLVAHRWGLDLPDLPDEPPKMVPMLPDEARSFVLRPANAVEAQIALRSLASEPYGIELDEAAARTVACGRPHSVLFTNRALGSPLDVRRLTAKRAFFGLVAHRSDETQLYSTSLLVLTTPGTGKIAVEFAAYQPNGTLVLHGAGSLGKDGLAFELRGVERRGAFAAQIEGTLAGSNLTLGTARVGCLLRQVGRPLPDEGAFFHP